jgi:hypothetical protein
MAREYNPNPWLREPFIDRTYPSGVAGARPKFTTRIHCGIDPESVVDSEVSGSESDNRVELFNRQLRAGHGFRNEGDE